uniref:Dipeptidyl peptidase 4 n=1 Tax=Homo sapiens TaxID=9606 RepID=A0A7I2V501_HUMAN
MKVSAAPRTSPGRAVGTSSPNSPNGPKAGETGPGTPLRRKPQGHPLTDTVEGSSGTAGCCCACHHHHRARGSAEQRHR